VRDTRRWLVLATCCASIVVVVMDISIVNVALPAIRRDLSASVTDLQWVVDAYTLVLAAFLVLAGSTADRVGRRRVFRVGLAVFGLGSVLCALAPTAGWLVAARVLQAGGATMLNPVAMAIVVTSFPDRVERARALGVFVAMTGLPLALGPVLGGALVAGLGWRAVFWVNVPVVLVALVATTLVVPESRAPRGRRADPIGQALVVAVLGGAVFAIIESGRSGWASAPVVGLLALAVLGVVGLVGYEPRRADPLLDLRLFRSAAFSSAIAIALLAFCGFGAALFTATLYLQDVRGLPAPLAGLCLLPVGLLILVLSPVSGRLVGSRGPRLPLVAAGVALAAGGAAAFVLGPDTPLPLVVAAFLPIGALVGLVNPPVANTAISGMPVEMAALAGSTTSVGRQTGTALGVAIAGTAVGTTAVPFTTAAHGLWWMFVGLGATVVVLGLVGTAQRPSGRGPV
jgi:EmrB/QacA subfamily drug resistance transporter